MVKRLGSFLIYCILFIIALLLFAPKENLYYLVEEKLAPVGIEITNEDVHEHLFSLELQSADVSFQGIQSAHIGSIKIQPYLLYNTIVCQDIKLAQMAKNFVPLRVDNLHISYTPLKPRSIDADAQGAFGQAHIVLDLKTMHIRVIVDPSKVMKTEYGRTLRMMKKTQNGEYIYDATL